MNIFTIIMLGKRLCKNLGLGFIAMITTLLLMTQILTFAWESGILLNKKVGYTSKTFQNSF